MKTHRSLIGGSLFLGHIPPIAPPGSKPDRPPMWSPDERRGRCSQIALVVRLPCKVPTAQPNRWDHQCYAAGHAAIAASGARPSRGREHKVPHPPTHNEDSMRWTGFVGLVTALLVLPQGASAQATGTIAGTV